MNNLIYNDYMQSPLGLLWIQASDEGLKRIEFVECATEEVVFNTHTKQAKKQLAEFFAGKRKVFDLKLAATGTDFQQRVWRQLLTVPFGQTATYQDIAIALDKPKAVRAVGAANGKNPIAIVVPCHRIIGANGKLTGYAGGLQRKASLLGLENPQSSFL